MQDIKKYGVHIDYCPTCNGVWLDKGEIDKMMAATKSPAAISQNKKEEDGQNWRDDYRLTDILAELRKEGRIS